MVLDESHRIKSPGSRVSLYCTALGKRVPYRMALTGTPAHTSPLDVYAQYRFLDPGILVPTSALSGTGTPSWVGMVATR